RRSLVAIDEHVVADDAVEDRCCLLIGVAVNVLAEGALERSGAGSIKRGGVLAVRTASQLQHHLVNSSHGVHEGVQPGYFLAISLTHSWFLRTMRIASSSPFFRSKFSGFLISNCCALGVLCVAISPQLRCFSATLILPVSSPLVRRPTLKASPHGHTIARVTSLPDSRPRPSAVLNTSAMRSSGNRCETTFRQRVLVPGAHQEFDGVRDDPWIVVLDGEEPDLVCDQLLHVQAGDAVRRDVADLPVRAPHPQHLDALLHGRGEPHQLDDDVRADAVGQLHGPLHPRLHRGVLLQADRVAGAARPCHRQARLLPVDDDAASAADSGWSGRNVTGIAYDLPGQDGATVGPRSQRVNRTLLPEVQGWFCLAPPSCRVWRSEPE